MTSKTGAITQELIQTVTTGMGDEFPWVAATGCIRVAADSFDGATVAFQANFENPSDAAFSTSWFDVDATETNFTANGQRIFTLPDCRLRINTSGGTLTNGKLFIKQVKEPRR